MWLGHLAPGRSRGVSPRVFPPLASCLLFCHAPRDFRLDSDGASRYSERHVNKTTPAGESMFGRSTPEPSRAAPPNGSSRMIWAKAMLLGSSWKKRCFGIGGVIVLLVLLVPRGQHEFSGKWRSLQGAGQVIVEDDGACRFRLAEFSGEGSGKLGNGDGIVFYRVDFRHRGFQQAMLLRGSPIWVTLGIASADVLFISPFYSPSEFHCVVVNLRRILVVIAVGLSLVALIVSWCSSASALIRASKTLRSQLIRATRGTLGCRPCR